MISIKFSIHFISFLKNNLFHNRYLKIKKFTKTFKNMKNIAFF